MKLDGSSWRTRIIDANPLVVFEPIETDRTGAYWQLLPHSIITRLDAIRVRQLRPWWEKEAESAHDRSTGKLWQIVGGERGGE